MRRSKSYIIAVVLFLSLIPFPALLSPFISLDPVVENPFIALALETPSTVGSTTTTEGTKLTYQRKTFLANGRRWVFYSNGTDIVYKTSTDGSSWSSRIVVTDDNAGYTFSVWFDDTYVHYACAPGNSYLYYRRGIPETDGSITWTTAEQQLTTVYDTTGYPTIAVDTDGYAWIGYRDSGATGYPYVIRSEYNNGTWGTTPSPFPYQLNSTQAGWWVTPTPLTSGKMYIVYAHYLGADDPIFGRLWTGSMGTEENATTSIFQEYYSVVADTSDNVYVAYINDDFNISSCTRTYGVGWGSESVIVPDGYYGQAPVLSIRNDAILYCFWVTNYNDSPLGATAGYVYYHSSTNGGTTWSSMVALVDESVDYFADEMTLSCFYKDYGTDPDIGLIYETDTYPYTVRYVALFQGGGSESTPTITSAIISDMDDTDNLYAMKKYYTFVVTVDDDDGSSNIDRVYLRGLNSSDNVVFEVRGTTLDTSPTFSIQSNSTKIDLDTATCSWGKSGDTGTATFRIRPEWDIEQYDGMKLSVYVRDDDGNSRGWTVKQTDYFDIITRLVTSNFAANATNVDNGDPLELSGNVYYSITTDGYVSSTSYPPDAQFTAVHIYNSTDDSVGSDSSIVNGAFSVEFNAPTVMGTYTYHVYLDLVADYTDANATDGDTVTVYVLNLQLVLLFSFDVYNNSTASDSSSSVNNGTIEGASRTPYGYYGRALSFDGDDFVNVTDDASLDISSEIAIGAWIRTTSADYQVILEKDGAYGLYVLPNYAIRLTINTTNIDTAPSQFSTDTWAHVIALYNGTYAQIYINNVIVTNETLTGSIATNANHLYVGNLTEGYIDEVKLSGTIPDEDILIPFREFLIVTYPYNLECGIEDMEASNWVLARNTYTFNGTYIRQNATYPFDMVRLLFVDGGGDWTTASYNITASSWTLSSAVVMSATHTATATGNQLIIDWDLYITDDIIDALNVDLWMYCIDTSDRDEYEVFEDYFNIYNYGGAIEVSSSGDGGQILGGGIFDVAAMNSSLSGGSWVRVNATWVNFQHIHTLVHYWQSNAWDTDHWDCPDEHNSTAYIDHGVDYWYNGTWLEGWKVRITVQDGKAGDYGLGSGQAWVEVNATWYNRGYSIKNETFLVFYEAYESNDISTQFSIWTDLWISSESGSSIVGGRVGAVYYGVNETGWGPWADWGPIEGVSAYSGFSDYLQDAENDTISASELKLFKVWVCLNKTAPDGGSPDCDSHQWAAIHEILHWRYLPTSMTLVGIPQPGFMPPTDPTMPVGWFTSLINSLTINLLAPLQSALIQAEESLHFVFAAIVDSAFGFFGYTGSFTDDAGSFIGALMTYISDSFTFVTNTITAVFSFILDTGTFIITWFTNIVNMFLQIATIVRSILDGTSTFLTHVGNVWTYISYDDWSDVVPLFILIAWFASVDDRGKRTGSWMSVFWSDLTIILAVISFIFDWSWRIISTVVDWIFRLISLVPTT